MARLARVSLLVAAGAALLAAASARADCCRLLKVDSETPPVATRVCTPDASGGCAEVLYLGTLQVGQSQDVCTPGRTVVYSEYDEALGDFGPYVEAVCNGDVEL